MGAELSALLDKPLVLIIVLAIGAVIGMGVEKLWNEFERDKRKAYWQGRNARKSASFKTVQKPAKQPDAKDFAADQLKLVMNADFRRRALLNRSEAKVFQSLDRMVIERNPEWQVMAQVSVGEFLACDDQDAYFAINSKRVDFVLMDDSCQARHALEYQGNGHHQGSAAARDAVKKEALRKAGVGYHEIVAGHTTPGELRTLVEKLVPPTAGVVV